MDTNTLINKQEYTNEYARKWHAEHAKQVNARRRQFRAEHIDEVRAKERSWKTNNPESVKASRKKDYAKHNDDRNKKSRERYHANPEHAKQVHHNYYLAHKDEIRDKNYKWVKDNPERAKAHHRKYMFGITADEYNLIFNKQEGRCALCGIHQSELDTALCVDHNHDTGKVRGLLCKPCNAALGLLGEDPKRLREAADYLEKVA